MRTFSGLKKARDKLKITKIKLGSWTYLGLSAVGSLQGLPNGVYTAQQSRRRIFRL